MNSIPSSSNIKASVQFYSFNHPQSIISLGLFVILHYPVSHQSSSCDFCIAWWALLLPNFATLLFHLVPLLLPSSSVSSSSSSIVSPLPAAGRRSTASICTCGSASGEWRRRRKLGRSSLIWSTKSILYSHRATARDMGPEFKDGEDQDNNEVDQCDLRSCSFAVLKRSKITWSPGYWKCSWQHSSWHRRQSLFPAARVSALGPTLTWPSFEQSFERREGEGRCEQKLGWPHLSNFSLQVAPSRVSNHRGSDRLTGIWLFFGLSALPMIA